MKRALCLFMSIFALFVLSQTARAQDEFAYGYAGVIQDGFPETNGAIIGLSVTGTTYGIATYYDSAHVSTLQENGVNIVQGYVQAFPEVYNFTVAPIHAGSVYQQFTDHILQIVTTFFCGIPFDAFGFSSWAYGFYGETSTWDPFPALCIGFTAVYIGYTVDQTQGQSQQACTEPSPCTLCKQDRRNREILCATVATGCEIAAFGVYNTAIGNCNNQAFCIQGNPNFNAAQCQNCKSTAKNALFIATAACGTTAVGCFLTLPDCTGRTRCVNGKPFNDCEN